MDCKDKKISVIGCARSGIAVAKLLANKGAKVFVSDSKDVSNFIGEKQVFDVEGIDYEFGSHSERVLEADFIVVSPGIPDKIPILKKAISQKIPLFSEIEIASRFCEAPIIAITGSNGKTTTTTLLGEIFKEAGFPTVVAGNIGLAFSEVVHKTRKNGVAIIEVSSFQLERIEKFKPKAAVFLNLTPDHLDRYANFIDYVDAKKKIYANIDETDFLVYNFDDSIVAQGSLEAKAQKIPFSTNQNLTDGVMISNGKIGISSKNQKKWICSQETINIRGEHNLSNALACIGVAKIFNVSDEVIIKVLKEFQGVEHRLEFVATIKNIDFINDSKATNVDSVWWALGSFKKNINLIAGGKDKEGDFDRLKEVISKKVKNLILLGEATEKIDLALGKHVSKVAKVKSMHEAVNVAFELAKENEVVLLSPACASFDLYKNYEERGRDFKNEVILLKEKFENG
ncbi:UDP-N-acetylmuramoyl-L-alanine--D-glutamate ligase [bacterium]|nr:UDP-N-acetylmuramoyl-L-alanine--D-glutamate ligase [bacterium]